MASFLKKILEPSEEDAFDHLTWMEKPRISIFEGLSPGDVLPSPNVGLPSALIPREPPGPAYVTHTGPLVRRLRQQEGPGRAAPDPEPHPAPERPQAEPEPRSEPRPRSQPGPSGRPEPPPAPPGLCHTILFARSPPCSALPPSRPGRTEGPGPAEAEGSGAMLLSAPQTQ